MTIVLLKKNLKKSLKEKIMEHVDTEDENENSETAGKLFLFYVNNFQNVLHFLKF